jgi:hypothetical protein
VRTLGQLGATLPHRVPWLAPVLSEHRTQNPSGAGAPCSTPPVIVPPFSPPPPLPSPLDSTSTCGRMASSIRSRYGCQPQSTLTNCLTG